MRFDLLFILLGLLWATAGPIVKNLDHLPVWLVIASRGFLGGAFVFAYSFKLERWRISGAHFWIAAFAACTCGFTFIASLQQLNTAVALGLFYAAMPVSICLISRRFLGEEPGRVDWLASILLIPCMLVLSWDKLRIENLSGLTFGVASGLAYAAFGAATKRISSPGERMGSLGLGSFGAILLLPLAHLSEVNLRSGDIVLLVSLALFNQAIPVMLTSYLFSHAPNVRRGVICMSLEIIFGIILSTLLSSDVPSHREVYACVCITAVVIGQTLLRKPAVA